MVDKDKMEFVLRSKIRGVEVTPHTISLSMFNRFNQEVEQLIVGSEKEVPLDEIHAEIEDGSYKLVVIIPAIISAVLAGDVRRLNDSETVNDIDSKRAEVILKWQNDSKKNDDTAYSVISSYPGANPVRITSETDYKEVAGNLWVDVEKYLLGEVMDMGGSTRTNIHLKIEGHKKALKINADQGYLRDLDENKLYKQQLLRVTGQENIKTGELRHLQLISFADYKPGYDNTELSTLIEKATATWSDVEDPSIWLNNLRGNEI